MPRASMSMARWCFGSDPILNSVLVYLLPRASEKPVAEASWNLDHGLLPDDSVEQAASEEWSTGPLRQKKEKEKKP